MYKKDLFQNSRMKTNENQISYKVWGRKKKLLPRINIIYDLSYFLSLNGSGTVTKCQPLFFL
jgi:hypothetical protein